MYKYIILLASCCTLFACKDDEGNGNGGNGVLLFSIEDDKKLGAQLKAEVFANPQEYPVLDTIQYAAAYSYLNDLKDQILNSGEIHYKDEFAWEVYIIENDSVLNAFASPGGYIFFYTGIIKYLDKEDDLMGVLGHEMAHADLRHSVRQLQKEYGISLLLSIVLGQDASALSQVLASLAGNVATLKFSRDDETEADLASVEYLDPLPHRCDAAATFFKKIGSSGTPTFLSTHPNSEDRVNQIQAKALELACDTTYFDPITYDTEFRDLLP